MGDTGSLALGGALGCGRGADQEGIPAGAHRWRLGGRGAVGDDPSEFVPLARQARLPHGAACTITSNCSAGPRPRSWCDSGSWRRCWSCCPCRRSSCSDGRKHGGRPVETRAGTTGASWCSGSRPADAPRWNCCGAQAPESSAWTRTPRGCDRAWSREHLETASAAADPALLDGIEWFVLSPGIPLTHPLVRAAAAAGIPVVSEIELGFRLHRCRDRRHHRQQGQVHHDGTGRRAARGARQAL